MRFYQNLCVGVVGVLATGSVMAQVGYNPVEPLMYQQNDVVVQAEYPNGGMMNQSGIYAPEISVETKNETIQKTVEAKTPYSILVCRSKQCAKAEYSMTREFLYNRMLKMFESNLNKDILLCEADPVSRVCYNHGIRVPANTNMFDVEITIPSARLLDAKLLKGQTALDLIFDYAVDINGMRAVCQSSITRLSVDFIDKAQMISPGFDCRFTTTGNTALNASYNIDYVDFDYGTIGAYYTVGIAEAIRGGASGYLLMRFVEPQVPTESKAE